MLRKIDIALWHAGLVSPMTILSIIDSMVK
jgi:hypothetical protein